MDAQQIHARALYLAKVHRKVDLKLIEILSLVDRDKVHRHFGFPSLFAYVVGALRLSESHAYALCSVARKCRELPQLARALMCGHLSTNKLVGLSRCSRRITLKSW